MVLFSAGGSKHDLGGSTPSKQLGVAWERQMLIFGCFDKNESKGIGFIETI